LHQVALKVVALMGEQYPELIQRQDLIASIAEQEEIRFRQTIERGLGMLEERFEIMKQTSSKQLNVAMLSNSTTPSGFRWTSLR